MELRGFRRIHRSVAASRRHEGDEKKAAAPPKNAARHALPYDEAHDFAFYVNELLDRLAIDVRPHPFLGQGDFARAHFVRIDREGDRAAELAIDLYANLDDVVMHQRRIELGPLF